MRSDRSAVPIEWRSRFGWGMTGLLCPGLALCGDGAALDLTGHWAGRAALAIFAVAYALVIAEETLPCASPSLLWSRRAPAARSAT